MAVSSFIAKRLNTVSKHFFVYKPLQKLLFGCDCSEFCNMVRRIMICSTQDVKKMKAGCKFPSSNDNETSASLEASEN